MKRILLLLQFAAFFGCLNISAQCPDNNVLLANVTPICDGAPHVAVNCISGGQYIAIPVVAGQTYTFTTCGNTNFDTQITLYNSTGGPALGYNDDFCGLQSTVTWVANFTGTLWVLVDLYFCNNGGACLPLTITCTAPPPPSTACLSPVPDLCANACSLGTLPTPAACPAGNGAAETFQMTNIGATAGNPYSTVAGCAVPASDVWYTFIATGTQLNLSIAAGVPQLNTPNVSLYQGANCASLLPMACFTGAAGNMATQTYSPLTPGQRYYLQISGANPLDQGNFNLTIQNNFICNACLLGENLTVNPPPTNGTYPPNTQVTFCYTVTNYNQTSANWLHGITLAFGNGWNLATLAPTSIPPSCAPDAGANWGWYNSCHGTANPGTIWGVGFYYDSPLGGPLDGNPGNNFGDRGVAGTACPITFCWHITTNANCAGGTNLHVAITETGDYLSGSWGAVGCQNDPVQQFNAVINCCTPPIMSAVNTTCGLCNGSTTASGQGTSPYQYIWNNSAGTQIQNVSGVAGPNTVNNLCAGQYFVTVIDATGCTSTGVATVNPSVAPTATASNTGPYCVGQNIQLNSTAGGTGYSWSGPLAYTAFTQAPTIPNATLGMAGTYTVTVTFAGGCTATASTNVVVNANPVAAINPAAVSICAGVNTTLNASGGGTYLWSNAFTTAGITVSPPSTTTYTVTVTNASNCTAVASAMVTVNPAPIATINPAAVSICPLGSATLTAGGGTSYLWSTAATTNAITVSPGATTTYNVTVTDGNGCTASTSSTVTVNPNPIAAINPPAASICLGTNTTLTASGGTTYSWSNLMNGSTITVSPGATTTYTVTVTDGNTCTATASATVTVNPLPVATIAPANVSICNGTNTTLTAGGGTTYLWSNGLTTSGITVSPASTTNYCVTVTDGNGCTASTCRTVTVNPAPIAAINPPAVSICPGANATLTASGGTTYAWNTGPTTAAITVTPGATTTYTVTVTNFFGCTASASSTVTINPAAIASITPPAISICSGTNATLTASGGVTYSWNTGPTTSVITVSPGATTTYTVTVTDGNTCTGTASSTVTVNPLPIAAINPAAVAICTGTSTTLTASGGVTYLWSDAETTSGITVAPLVTTNYDVTVTDGNACSATATSTVTVNPLPIATINPPAVSICTGSSTTLTAAGGTTYLWDDGETTAPITVTPVATTTYNVTVTDANGCTATANSTVTVNASAIASINPPSVAICAGDNTSLTASGGATYLWSDAETTGTITVTPIATTPYDVTVTDANGCTGTASSTVTVNPLPIAAINPAAVAICTGTSTTLTASGGVTYLWSDAETTSGITVAPLVTTNYDVTVTDGNACSATATSTVTVNPLPIATINPPAVSICTGSSTTLTAAGGTTYLWDDGETTAPITVTPVATTIYNVTVTDANGCTATANSTVTVNASAIASINPPSVAICAGDNTSLTASGGATYLWSDAETTGTITVTPIATTPYDVTVTDANGCTGTASSTVTVNPLPIAAINPAAVAICTGTSTTLTASGGVTYLWSDAETTSGITVAPLVTTNYDVTVTDGNACSATATSTVTVNPLPIATINPPAVSICTGSSTTLTAAGGTTYLWDDGETTAPITVTPVATTIYNVTVTDANGCTATANSTVTVNASAIASINPPSVAICAGDNTSLTASGGATYLWSDAETTGTITVTPIATTPYDVTVTDANGCTGTASSTVTVNPLPIAAINPAAVAICTGTSTTLTASGGVTYLWSDAETTSGITVAPLVTTNYDVTVTDGNACSATATSTVTVNPLPIATINPPAVSICTGSSTTLTAAGGTTYLWDDGETTAPITVTPVATTTYNVTVTDANGCTATANSTVTVNASAIASINPPSVAICAGDNTSLTASGGATYLWSDAETTGTITVTPIATTPYDVTVTDANGCTGTASSTVTVNPLPIAAINPAAVAICTGTSTTLTASGGVTYLWSDAETTSGITVAPLVTTNYDVTVTDGNACSATATSTVTVNPLPIATINPPAVSICTGSSTTLTAAGGTTYLWDDGETTAPITVTPVATTIYNVTVTDANGCTATANSTVTVNASAIASINPPSVAICAGDNTSLTASGGATYLWSDAETTGTITVTPIATTPYDVTVTDANGCTGTASSTVTVNPLPIAAINPAAVAICTGTSTTLTASGGVTYLWSDAETTSGITVAPLVTTNYDVTVTDGNACSATATSTVTVNPLPIATINPPAVSICTGSSTILTAAGGTSYLWDDGETTAAITITPVSTVTIGVTVTDANTCTGSATSVVTVNPLPIAAVNPPAVSICAGDNTSLTASGGVSYVWSDAETISTITVSPVATINYDVTVTDANSCTATATSVVTVNPLPIAAINPAAVAICSGTSTTLTASGGNTYIWSDGETVASITVTPLITGNFDVTVTDNNLCSATATSTVTVNPLPVASINPAAVSICSGSNTTLTASGGATYLWSDAETTPAITVAPVATINYDVTVTDVNACTASATSTVTVNALPIAAVNPPAVSICAGDNTSLTASGGVSYVWSDAETISTITVSPVATINYDVTVTDANSCTATATSVVTVNPLPIAAINPAAVAICSGTSTTLTASGGNTYIWSDGETVASITVTPLITGNFDVTVTDNNLCSATATSTVTVNPLPVASINPAAVSICSGSNTTLTASGGATYLWSDAETTPAITVAPVATINYDVTVTDVNACTASATSTVTVNALPIAAVNPPAVSICAGDNTSLTASGGVSYVWSDAETISTITVSPVATINYDVTVTDANSCTATATSVVTVNPLPIAAINPAAVAICSGTSTTLTASGGNTYIWSDGETVASITVTPLITGNFDVTVTDNNLCSATATSTVTVNPLPVASINPAAVSICSGSNTTLTASGGATYLWSDAETTPAITVAPVATINYDVTVTDVNACTASATSTVTVNALPIAAVNPPAVSICAGDNTSLTASGGVSYVWSDAETISTITVSPVATINYDVTVTDANSCTATATSVVTVNPLPIAAINPAAVAICSGTSTTLTASGGNTYIWSDGETVASITVTPLITGNFDVTVTDNNLCSATATSTVTVNPLPVASINPAAVSICSGSNTTLTASGGATYLWSDAETTPAITVAPVATINYDVTVTDVNACTASATSTVTVNALPIAAVNPPAVSICAGDNTSLTASGGVSYVWSDAETISTITVSPVATINYDVTVTDANSCTATATSVVTVNPLPIAAINPAAVAICSGTSTTLTASGGNTYIWSDGETVASITVTPLITGNFDVTVTDNNLCSATATSTVTVNPLPVASINPAAVSICSGSNTTLTASGGATYLWSDAETTPAITVAPVATINYDVTVTDVNACTASATSTVTVNALPIAAVNPPAVSICAGTSTTLTASGGTIYLWSTTETVAVITVTPVATTPYDVTVTDGNGCSATATSTVTVNPLPVAAINPPSAAICAGNSASLTASGGNTYLWSDNESTSAITVTPANTTTYDVTVTDANICTASMSATVTVNPNPVATITPVAVSICFGANTTLTASGGTTYLWSTGDFTPSITISPATTTTIVVTVTDVNACTASATSTVTVNALPVAAVNPPAVSICSGDNTTLTASGGTIYLWSTTDSTAVITVSPTVNTTYTVTVTDANSCTATSSSVVTVNPLPVVAITPPAVSICSGSSTSLVAAGGNNYAWSTGETTSTITVTPPATATYSVTVLDANTCSGTASSVVTVDPAITLTFNITHVSCNGGNNGAVDMTVAGGTPAFIYTWSTGATTEDIAALVAGSYDVTVTDNVCTATGNAVVTEPPVLTFTETHQDVACHGNSTGSITTTTAGGTVPYGYMWNDGVITPNRLNIPAGLYTATITDANNCSASISVIINEPAGMSITEIHTDVSCFGGNDGTITPVVVGGVPAYSCIWNDGVTTCNRTTLVAAIYTLAVTDQNQCTIGLTVTIGQPTQVAVFETHTDALCFGSSDGTITVTDTGGIAPYTYAWSDGANTSPNRTGLPAGTYTVTVTDNHQCTISLNITLGQPNQILLTASTIDPTCITNPADGSILVAAFNSTGPYTYVWSNGGATGNLAPGNYTVTVTDANNCSTDSTFTLAYQYSFTITANPGITIDLGASTTLGYTLNGNAGTFTNAWNPVNPLSCSDCASPTASPVTTTLFNILITNSVGCTANDTVTVTVIPNYSIFVPNAFTPNGDGNNELFQIYGNLKGIEFLEMSLFNRWGEKVFESNDHHFTWDGTYKGVMQSPQVFVWQLKLTYIDGHREELRVGSVTLIK